MIVESIVCCKLEYFIHVPHLVYVVCCKEALDMVIKSLYERFGISIVESWWLEASVGRLKV